MFRVCLFVLNIGLLLLPLTTAPAQAASGPTFDGCFARSSTATTIIVWVTAPRCTITPGDTSFTYSVLNIDGVLYTATPTNGDLDVTSTVSSLEFTTDASSGAITIKPFDYDPDTGDFYFAAIGDPQTQSGTDPPNPIFVEILRQIGLLHLPFVTVSGDIIRGDTESSQNHAVEYAILDNVFQAFPGSAFLVPGDHDARQSIGEYYEALYGPEHHTFVYGNTRFVAINSVETEETEGTISAEALDFLESTLAESTEQHKIVYWHHPLKTPAWASTGGINNDQEQQLAELFVQYGVELLITGEAHGYDYEVIDSTDYPGLNGSFAQLVSGGSGGAMNNYDGDHFFVLVHVADSGITVQRIDYSGFGFRVDALTANDGSSDSVMLSIENDSPDDIDFFRATAQVSVDDHITAADSAGQFYAVNTTTQGDVTHASVDLGLTAGESTTLTIGHWDTVLAGIKNNVTKAGVIDFSRLPTSDNTQTELSVDSAEAPSTVSIRDWNTSTDTRQWQEETKKEKRTTFRVSGLTAGELYTVKQDGAVIAMPGASSSGQITVQSRRGKKTRQLSLTPANVVLPSSISLLPASNGGSNLQVINQDGKTINSFFAYDSSLLHGFDGVWADVDGDSRLEIVTVPKTGTNGQVRIFEQSGTVVGQFFPFGEDFTGGISVVAADVNGDGDDEIVVAPASDHSATVAVYNVRRSGSVAKMADIAVFPKIYTGGVSIAAGDIDGDGDDDVVTAAHQQQSTVSVYRYAKTTGTLKLLAAKNASAVSSAAGGYSLTTGDVDFDQKAEIVVGSYSGDGRIGVLHFDKGALHVKSRKTVFGTGFSGGVNLAAGNLDSSYKAEVVVTPRTVQPSGARVQLLRYSTSADRLKKYGVKKPFGGSYQGGLAVSLADIDADFDLEVVTAQAGSSNTVRAYSRHSTKIQRVLSESVYSASFAGGLSLIR